MQNETYLKVIALLLFTVSPLLAQENIPLNGKITAPFLEGSSVHIINSTQSTGTVNSGSGAFQILVKENDELLFSSIQYKNVTIQITSEIIGRGTLDITLEEDINVLDDVNISNINLSGNIRTDIQNMKVLDNLPLNYGLSDIEDMIFEADINDSQNAPKDIAFESNEILQPGLNLMAIPGVIEALFNKKERKFLAYVSASKASTEELRHLFQEDFFVNTLKVEKQYINDFIFYAIDQGLNEVIKQSNKLTVTEFLIKQSRSYNMQLNKN